jgi:O-antigen/teichoic acid export membrane protein
MNLAELFDALSPRRRFNRDVLWNLASLGVLGASGVLSNFLIIALLGPDALGVFVQVFAVYAFLAQLSTGGAHLSVLKYVAEHRDDRETCGRLIVHALLITLGIAGAICIAAYAAKDRIGGLLDSPGVAAGLVFTLPGLVANGWNKCLLSVLNAARHMRAYAVFQALRFTFVFAALLILALQRVEASRLTLAITAGEVALFAVLSAYVHVSMYPLRRLGGMARWIPEHVSFGSRALLSGVLGNLNARVDVLMIGHFLSDAHVGVYGFASTLAEGFGMLAGVVQLNLAPLIGQALADRDPARITEMAGRVKRVMFPAMIALGGAAASVFPVLVWAVRLVNPAENLWSSWPVFGILVTGHVVSAAYLAFASVFVLGGRPGMATWFVVAGVAANVALNAALIPFIGVFGAAAASATTLVFQAMLLIICARRYFDVRL